MNYYDIGNRLVFEDWVWILLPSGLERRRGMRTTHEISWPKMDRVCPSGRLEQDTGRVSVVIPEGCGVSLDEVKVAVSAVFGAHCACELCFFVFDRKD